MIGRVTNRADLRDRPLTYDVAGSTAPAEQRWVLTPAGFRRYERTVDVSTSWEHARELLLGWAVKTRSGFDVDTAAVNHEIECGARVWIRLTVGPFAVSDPVEVVATFDTPTRCGFAYGTLDGHPVSGEEAFIVHRPSESGPVSLTIRSLTRAAPSGPWRYAFPALVVVQRASRRRYLRSLNHTPC